MLKYLTYYLTLFKCFVIAHISHYLYLCIRKRKEIVPFLTLKPAIMKKITLRKLEDLASQLVAKDPECVRNATPIYDDGVYIGILYCSPVLSSTQVHMISRCLSGIYWYIEKIDSCHFFISFKKNEFFNERL